MLNEELDYQKAESPYNTDQNEKQYVFGMIIWHINWCECAGFLSIFGEKIIHLALCGKSLVLPAVQVILTCRESFVK